MSTGPHKTPLLRPALPDYGWSHVERLQYKPSGDAPFSKVSRQVLFEPKDMACQWRYFEVLAGGYSTLERHQHVHAVMILRGRGHCLLASDIHPVAEHDLIDIPPMTWHQFRADQGVALGFLCLVPSDRDRPQLPTDDELKQLKRNPAVRLFLEAND